MTIEELIEKHVHAYWKTDIDPLEITRPDQRYRDFAIELLEMVKNSSHLKVVDPGVYVGTLEAQHNYGDTIQAFLDELKKGTP